MKNAKWDKDLMIVRRRLIHNYCHKVCDESFRKSDVTRTANTLLRYGCKSLDDIAEIDDDFEKMTKNIGPKSMEIIEKLKESLSAENNIGAYI